MERLEPEPEAGRRSDVDVGVGGGSDGSDGSDGDGPDMAEASRLPEVAEEMKCLPANLTPCRASLPSPRLPHHPSTFYSPSSFQNHPVLHFNLFPTKSSKTSLIKFYILRYYLKKLSNYSTSIGISNLNTLSCFKSKGRIKMASRINGATILYLIPETLE